MATKWTHVRIRKDMLDEIKLIGYKPSEVIKVGYNTLKGINNMGKFIYGKRVWK